MESILYSMRRIQYTSLTFTAMRFREWKQYGSVQFFFGTRRISSAHAVCAGLIMRILVVIWTCNVIFEACRLPVLFGRVPSAERKTLTSWALYSFRLFLLSQDGHNPWTITMLAS